MLVIIFLIIFTGESIAEINYDLGNNWNNKSNKEAETSYQTEVLQEKKQEILKRIQTGKGNLEKNLQLLEQIQKLLPGPERVFVTIQRGKLNVYRYKTGKIQKISDLWNGHFSKEQLQLHDPPQGISVAMGETVKQKLYFEGVERFLWLRFTGDHLKIAISGSNAKEWSKVSVLKGNKKQVEIPSPEDKDYKLQLKVYWRDKSRILILN